MLEQPRLLLIFLGLFHVHSSFAMFSELMRLANFSARVPSVGLQLRQLQGQRHSFPAPTIHRRFLLSPLLKQYLPPQVRMSVYGEVPVIDCAEAALRAICNTILANPEEEAKQFDCGLIPIGCSPRHDFKKFYQDNATYSVVNTTQVGQQWFNLVSNISGINYCRKNYEMRSTQENLLGALNYLFGVNASNWEKFGTLLSNEKQKILCIESGSDTVYISAEKYGFYQQMLKIQIERNQTTVYMGPTTKDFGQLTRYLSLACLARKSQN